MPSAAIKALQQIDTRASGTSTQSVALKERKVIRQSRVSAPKIASNMVSSACATASLVAAITPTLPAARRSCTPSTGLASMNFLISLTTWAMVVPSWFLVKIITWIALQPSMFRPKLGSKAFEPVDSPVCERGSARQRGLPSLKAPMISLPMPATLVTERTPSTPRRYSSKRSIRPTTS